MLINVSGQDREAHAFLENKAFTFSGRQETNLGARETPGIPPAESSKQPVGLGRNSARLWFQLCYIQITLNKKKFYDITKPSLSYVDSLARNSSNDHLTPRECQILCEVQEYES